MKSSTSGHKTGVKKAVEVSPGSSVVAKRSAAKTAGSQTKVKAAAPAAKKAAQSPGAQAEASKASQAAKASKVAKSGGEKKPKLVRDSFTLPQADHELIKQCKKVALASGRETKKSEVVRAAIQSFAALPVARQIAAYGKLQAIALGRPKGN